MNTISSLRVADFESRYPDVFNPSMLKRFMPLLIGAGIVLYLIYCWWFFSIGTVLATGQWQRAEIYARDWISYAIRTTVRIESRGYDRQLSAFFRTRRQSKARLGSAGWA